MRRSIWILVGVTVAFCVLLASDIFPALRGDLATPGWLPVNAIWLWLTKTPRLPGLLACVFGLTVYSVGAWHLLNRGKTRAIILWAFCGAVLLPMLIMTLDMRPLDFLITRSTSLASSDYHDATFLIDNLGQALRSWPEFMSYYHPGRHTGGISLAPPGLVVAYLGVARLLESTPSFSTALADIFRQSQCNNFALTAWSNVQWSSLLLQVTMPIWSALAVAPLYRFGKLAINREAARAAVLLYPLVPGILVFIPRFNAAYILLTAVMLSLVWTGLKRLPHPSNSPSMNSDRGLGGEVYFALAGFVCGMGTFFNTSLIPLGLLVGLMLIFTLWRHPRRLISSGVAFGVGCSVIWVIYGLLTGITPLTILRTAFGFHYLLERPYPSGLELRHADFTAFGFHYLLERPYLPWLFLHTYDMYFWVGIPITALCLWHGGRSPFGRAALLTLFLLVMSGTARGETGRVWLWLAPCWLLMAGASLVTLRSRERAMVLAAQAVLLLTLAAVLNANFSEFNPPIRPDTLAGSAPTIPLNGQFGTPGEATISLLGVTPERGTIRLFWRANQAYVRNPYVISILPIAADGTLGGAVEYVPGGWEHPYPPACWVPGDVLDNSAPLRLASGTWAFSVRLVDSRTGEPMRAGADTQVGFGPVQIP